MKLLFSMRHAGALRNFASTIRELAKRGHQVHLVFMMRDKRGDDRLVHEIAREFPSVTHEQVSEKTAAGPWADVARDVRATADYLRYFAPEYHDAHALRARAEARVPAPMRTTLVRTAAASTAASTAASVLLHAVERAIPPAPSVLKLVSRHKADAVLVTPLVDLGSDQVEYVKAARALGIPSGLCVHSWDNLTNKGVIHARPDRVFVWNEAQKREAVVMHGIKPAQVVVTGAPVFDAWFNRRPSTTREEFCARVGLPAGRRLILYLCSSQFIAPHEDDFIRTWLRAVRSAGDPTLREAGVLVRLHPRTHPKHADRFQFTEFSDVAVWPPGGANPVDEASKNDYFDSLYHAAAAVGVNTTAQIEAAIVGRPVLSMRVPEYVDTQEGTVHFHYLLRESGGLLEMADTLDAHVRALADALNGRRRTDARRLRTFVQAFVRPHGLDVEATPLLATEIEVLAALPRRAPAKLPVWLYPMRLALYPIAVTKRAVNPAPARHATR
jgi:hypothetical protein